MKIFIKKFSYTIIFLLIASPLLSQEKISISLTKGKSISKNLSKTFSGQYNKNLLYINPRFSYEKNNINIYLSPIFSENNSILSYGHISYKFNTSSLIFGRFLTDSSSENNLFSTGSMIESGNSIPIPRIGITTNKELWGINFNFELYHGVMDKNSQILERPYLHDKKLYASKKIGDWELSTGIHHIAIWGGESVFYGKQPSSFKDYVRIFLGDKSEDGRGSIEDQNNALGDVRGMWDFSVTKNTSNIKTKLYFQSFFEDKSGLQLNRNASEFDGLKGIQISNDKILIIFENLKTTFQGGSSHPPGVDSYYFTKAYPPGWEYKGQSIGNAFISPFNNRVLLNHIFTKFNFNKSSIMFSIVKGKYFYPFTEKIDYSEIIENETGNKFEEAYIGFSKTFNEKNTINLFIDKSNSDFSYIFSFVFDIL